MKHSKRAKHIDRREFVKYMIGAGMIITPPIAAAFAAKPPPKPKPVRPKKGTVNINLSLGSSVIGTITQSPIINGVINIVTSLTATITGAIHSIPKFGPWLYDFVLIGAIVDPIWKILVEKYFGTSYVDTTVVPGTTYQYRVTDSLGAVFLSNIVTL